MPCSTRPIPCAWLILASATALAWSLGLLASPGLPLVLGLFALAALKGAVVILDFMELRHAPPLWRRLLLGWLGAVLTLILLAYRMSLP